MNNLVVEEYEEALVLGVSIQEHTVVLELCLSDVFVGKNDKGYREFNRLIFHIVGPVVVKDRVARMWDGSLYRSNDDNADISMYSVNNTSDGANWQFRAVLSSLGVIEIKYTRIDIYRKVCKCEIVDGDFLYRDVKTGQLIDFDNPFLQ